MRTLEELERIWAGLPAPPRGAGTVRLVCLRRGGGVHEFPERVEVSVERGLAGDRWAASAEPDREAQVTLMNAAVAGLLAGDTEARAGDGGDSFLVDLDLDEAALPAGARVRIGGALLVISEKPHTGCRKFRDRFGREGLRFVNARPRRRGVNCRVLQGGSVAVGDPVQVVPAPMPAPMPARDR